MAIYDPGNTVPVRGVDADQADKYHPLDAVMFAEENGIDPEESIFGIFSQDEKNKLLSMVRDGEFNQLEGAVIRWMLAEGGTLEDIGAMIGAHSRRTKGEPTSKPGALKEFNRILDIMSKRYNLKHGTHIDFKKNLKDMKEVMKKIKIENAAKRKLFREKRRHAKQVEQEFYKLLRELNTAQDERGLPRSKYYSRYFAPADKQFDPNTNKETKNYDED